MPKACEAKDKPPVAAAHSDAAVTGDDGEIYDIIAGTFFICGLGSEEFASLSNELQRKYEGKFKNPEAFLKMGSKIMAIPTEPAKAETKPDKKAPGMDR